MWGECVISSVLSHHNKNLKWRTSIKALRQTVSQFLDRSVLQLCFTAQFYLENKGKYILKMWGHADPKDMEGRERESAWERERETPSPWLLFLFIYLFFSLPLGLPYVNWASQECCLFYLRSSLRSSDFVLFYCCGLFPSLSFSHCHSRLLFSVLTT